MLALRGDEVRHLLPSGAVEAHAVTPFAVVQHGVPRYPAPQLGLGF